MKYLRFCLLKVFLFTLVMVGSRRETRREWADLPQRRKTIGCGNWIKERITDSVKVDQPRERWELGLPRSTERVVFRRKTPWEAQLERSPEEEIGIVMEFFEDIAERGWNSWSRSGESETVCRSWGWIGILA